MKNDDVVSISLGIDETVVVMPALEIIRDHANKETKVLVEKIRRALDWEWCCKNYPEKVRAAMWGDVKHEPKGMKDKAKPKTAIIQKSCMLCSHLRKSLDAFPCDVCIQSSGKQHFTEAEK